MNNIWCLRQIEEYDDSFYSDWELASLESTGATSAKIVPLDHSQIGSWAEQQKGNLAGTVSNGDCKPLPRVAILLLRHKLYKSQEVNPQYLPLERGVFLELIKSLGLPPAYIYIRGYTGACGNFSVNHIQEEGKPTKIGLSVRVPHSPTNEIKSVWSLTLVWNETGFLTGIFEGASDKDTEFLLDAINSDDHFHPLDFPLYLLELLHIYYNSMRREKSTALLRLERAVGLTRGKNPRGAWYWNEREFRLVIKDVNSLNTHLAYLERRLDFLTKFSSFLQDQVSEANEDPKQLETRACVKLDSIKERLYNVKNSVSNQMHHIQCLQKRSATVISVVYSVITQRDSSSNLRIASAAKEDSEVMKLIALLTTIFLPAMFISSLFGMNFFLFDTEHSRIILSGDFWKYWAVVLPITLSLVLCGSYYTMQRHARADDDDSADTSRNGSGSLTNNTVPNGPFLNPYAWFNLPYHGEDHFGIPLDEQPHIHTQDSFFT